MEKRNLWGMKHKGINDRKEKVGEWKRKREGGNSIQEDVAVRMRGQKEEEGEKRQRGASEGERVKTRKNGM